VIKSISSAAVVVKDGKKAKKWYNEKLGFVVKSDDDHWITVAPPNGNGFEIHLCETKPLEKGNTGILFLVDNLDKTYAELTRKGVKFSQKPVDKGWGKYAMMKDLDGNVFWMMEES
jgi:lactoylglutathione lyase